MTTISIERKMLLLSCTIAVVATLLGYASPRFTDSHLQMLLESVVAGGASTSCKRPKVIIVGAGAAGLTAAKRLRHGFHNGDDNNNDSDHGDCSLTPEVLILEASSGFGGRVQKDATHFADYPLDLGASWVYDPMTRIPLFAHNRTKAFRRFLKRTTVAPSVQYDDTFESYRIPFDGSLHSQFDMGDEQSLWIEYSWYDFLKEQIVEPSLQDRHFVYNCPVDRIAKLDNNHYDGTEKQQLLVACGEQQFIADHVIVTVPLQILQDGDIEFSPPINEKRKRKLFQSKMWQGFKIFLEFSEKFYYDEFEWISDDGELDFWDYSLVQPHTEQNIVAGYFIGDVAAEYKNMTDDQIATRVLKFLDNVFGQERASRHCTGHMIVNWSNNPYIRGIYSNEALRLDKRNRGGPRPLWGSNNRQLLVAGEAFPVPPDHNGWVDGAALSGLHAAELILHHMDPERLEFSIPEDFWEDW